jgi:hypothetical protein
VTHPQERPDPDSVAAPRELLIGVTVHHQFARRLNLEKT